MADKLNSGDIYTNAVGNNLVVVDPNKIVANGKVKDRLVDHEDMVMYANLTARIFPRSKIIAGGGAGDMINVDIFDGEINFLKPSGTGNKLNSDWTEAFTNPDINKKVKTVDEEGNTTSIRTENTVDFQGFGITSISIKLNTSYIPQVAINFTDVRGKTLFEQARGNTPYTAFFHLPYPTFYLTVKGYYGKAVKYQLMMEKFNSRFDPSSGDYLITCNFIGNHVALLRDINMHQVLTAPYMYPTRCDEDGCISDTFGKQTLKEVYRTYREKKLVSDNFPESAEMTTVELIEKMKVIDNDMGKLFGEASLEMTTDKLEYEGLLKDLRVAIISGQKGWKNTFLDKGSAEIVQIEIPSLDASGKTINVSAYPLNGISLIPEGEDPAAYKQGIIEVAKKSFESILEKFHTNATENKTFGPHSESYPVTSDLITKYKHIFNTQILNEDGPSVLSDKLVAKSNPWLILDGFQGTILKLIKDHEIEFKKKAEDMSEAVTEILNSKIESELGFKPTIRNVFMIILAGADTFLRLMDDVHTVAMLNKSNPKRLEVSKDSNNKDLVYPWPQYYVVEEEDECTTSSVLKYPGAKDVIEQTGADDSSIWPEVLFVEEYTKTAIYKSSDYNLETPNQAYVKDFTPITLLDYGYVSEPYSQSTYFVDLLWEIVNRAQMSTVLGSFATRFGPGIPVSEVFLELGKYDGTNLFNKIKDSYSLNLFFSEINSINQLFNTLEIYDKTNYNLYVKSRAVPQFLINNSVQFNLTSFPNDFSYNQENFEKSEEYLKKVKSVASPYDLAPTMFIGPTIGWLQNNFADGQNLQSGMGGDFYSISKGLEWDVGFTYQLKDKFETRYFTEKKYTSGSGYALVENVLDRFNDNPQRLSTNPEQFYEDFDTTITEAVIKRDPTVSTINNLTVSVDNYDLYTSILNTPYFINAVINGVNNEIGGGTSPYVAASYLFLNSLPLPTFREKVLIKGETEDATEFGPYISQLFNQLPALHKVPLPLLLRIGSIWHRYKSAINGGGDILNINTFNNLGGTLGPAEVYDGPGGLLTTQFNYVDSAPSSVSTIIDGTQDFGIYRHVITSLHYIVSGTLPNAAPVAALNNILDPTGGAGAPLTISINQNITSTTNPDFKFYDVSLNSNNITNSSLEALGKEDKNYYVLYPSSGALTDSEVDNQWTTGTGLFSTSNGACRLVWGLSNYGYFQHNTAYLPATHEYFKLIDTQKEEQDNCQLREDGIHSTIEELRGVFTTEQLDLFERDFLEFAGVDPKSFHWSLKHIVKELMIIEEDFISTSTAAIRVEELLKEGQLKKFANVMSWFLNTDMNYAHITTTGLNDVTGASSLLQKLRAIKEEDPNYNFGDYTASTFTIPLTAGGLASQEYRDVRIYIGEYYIQSGPQYTILTTTTNANPIFRFFTSITDKGITFSSQNIKQFAPFIRMYCAYCVVNGTIDADTYLSIFLGEMEKLSTEEVNYLNQLLNTLKAEVKIKDETTQSIGIIEDMADSRTAVDADDLKLDLYNQFKVFNDRWVSGLDVKNHTLFERFLFFDRANRDIGDKAIINIWDILKLDTPFDVGNDKTLTQSVSSYLSTILANNYFNFIPLPAYINFYQVGNDNSQEQGNAMFKTYTTVDYLDSAPAFLCQYVGPPSSQLNVKTTNNGYSDDGFSLNLVTNNPLAGPDCGNKNLSNKVMGFNVDFGIPNQNIFESVTLDQSQFTNTSESYQILQQMADSGAGGATSMASSSLYNVYASRSYTATITCIGNVTIQPTMYFQLRYLPMFNGPYLILDVEHTISPNNIETSFGGVRVPIPKLPNISDLTQRINQKLYVAAEQKVKQRVENKYYDDNNATPKQLELTKEDTGFIDFDSDELQLAKNNDPVTWSYPISVDKIEKQPTTNKTDVHLGIDLRPIPSQFSEANSKSGMTVHPIIGGVVIETLDGCKPQQSSKGCGKYGNYVKTRTEVLGSSASLGETVYYDVIYGFLREGSVIKMGSPIAKITDENIIMKDVAIGTMGNSGLSRGLHTHIEIKRGVINTEGKTVEHYIAPENMLPNYYP